MLKRPGAEVLRQAQDPERSRGTGETLESAAYGEGARKNGQTRVFLMRREGLKSYTTPKRGGLTVVSRLKDGRH